VLTSCALLGVGCGGGDDDGAGSASDACRDGCVLVMAADCDNGPPTQDQCESDCKMLESGSCASEYEALQTCAEGKQVTCSSAGLPTVSACASETSAFVSCLN
jgi:hypothetical protein